MGKATLKLNSGGWVHIFPEGSRSRDGGRTMGSAKKFVARYDFMILLLKYNIPIKVFDVVIINSSLA